MDILKRPPTLTEKRLKEAREKLSSQGNELLNTQELAASLFEENTSLKSQLLDTQAIVATLVEGGNV